MAVASYWSSSTMVKAVLLPLILVLLAVAAAASSSEDGPAVATSGGRFSATPAGRKLLTLTFPLNFCGSGSAPNYDCKEILGEGAKDARCCVDAFNITQGCWDVGSVNIFKCGSCNTTCNAGDFCCDGVCANILTSKNNCGFCGNRCRGSLNCTNGMCGY